MTFGAELENTTAARFADWTDEQLLLAYRDQEDRALFEELVRRYESELMVFLRRFVGDEQLAEDVFQAAFLSVHLRVDQFQETRRVKPWIYAIASNKAIDLQRRLKRHKIPSLDAPLSDSSASDGQAFDPKSRLEDSKVGNPSSNVEKIERCDRIRHVVSLLPPETQQLMNLVFYESMKYADISDTLGIPVGTVKSRVHTAMRKLRTLWLRTFPQDELSDVLVRETSVE